MIKEKIKLLNKVFLLIVLTILLVSGFWAVDIGASTMISDAASGSASYIGGYGFIRTPIQQYHLGFILILIAFLILVISYLFEIIGKIKIRK